MLDKRLTLKTLEYLKLYGGGVASKPLQWNVSVQMGVVPIGLDRGLDRLMLIEYLRVKVGWADRLRLRLAGRKRYPGRDRDKRAMRCIRKLERQLRLLQIEERLESGEASLSWSWLSSPTLPSHVDARCTVTGRVHCTPSLLGMVEYGKDKA